MKKSISLFFFPFAFLLFTFYLLGCSGDYAPMKTVEKVDLNRYLGKWYEIARLPNKFQEGCVCTTAEYEMIDEETIRVTNTCREDSASGDIDDVEGKAFIVENSGNAKLKVQFFWPFKGDYWIIELDKDYQYALVGTPSRKYLWILARRPVLDEAIYNNLFDVAKSEGFDTSQMIVTEHPCKVGAQY
ncbi:MAG: lipocalin family protein [Bacteroidetes bacterium]|nr:lipocalin family protein [Bacteroidota bacterium]